MVREFIQTAWKKPIENKAKFLMETIPWHMVLKELYPYICAIYLLDSLSYVKKNQMVLFSLFGQNFKSLSKGIKILFAWPFSQTTLHNKKTVMFGINKIYFFNTASNSNQLLRADDFLGIPYEDIKDVKVSGAIIFVNGKKAVELSTITAAKITQSNLIKIISSSTDDRGIVIDSVSCPEHNAQNYDQMFNQLKEPLFFLKTISLWIFLLIFSFLPFALYTSMSLNVNVKWFLVYIAIVVVGMLAYSGFLYRKYLSDSFKDLFSFLSPFCFFPFSAPQIPIQLVRQIYSMFDHVLVASKILPKGQKIRFLKKESVILDVSLQGAEDVDFYNAIQRRIKDLEQIFTLFNLSRSEIFSPPIRRDLLAVNYCPLCEAEYTQGVKKCSDCLIELKQYSLDKEIESSRD